MSGQEYFEMLDAAITGSYWLILAYVYWHIMLAIVFKELEAHWDTLLTYAVVTSLIGQIQFHREYNFTAPLEVNLIFFSPIVIIGSVLIVWRYISKDIRVKDPALDNNAAKTLVDIESSLANYVKFIAAMIMVFALYITTWDAYHHIIRPALKSIYVQ